MRRLQGLWECAPADIQVVRTASDYGAAQAAGKHATFIAIQSGNAFDASLDALDLIVDNLGLHAPGFLGFAGRAWSTSCGTMRVPYVFRHRFLKRA